MSCYGYLVTSSEHTNHPTTLAQIPLLVQSLLPPIAPIVRRRVHHLADPRDVEVLDRSIGAVYAKVRHARLVRRPGLGEVSDILLQSDGKRVAQDCG